MSDTKRHDFTLPVVYAEDHPHPCRVDLRLGGMGHERRVLLVGNSLTHYNQMPRMLEHILNAVDDRRWAVSSVTRGGANIAWHRKMGYAEALLSSGIKWDAVVIQDSSRRPAEFPQQSTDDVLALAAMTTAQVYGFLTWNILGEEPLVDVMAKTLQQLQPTIQPIPIGHAWRRFSSSGFDGEANTVLYEPDNKHPSSLGSFLTALCMCQVFLDRLPTPMPEANSGDCVFPIITQEQLAMLCEYARTGKSDVV